MKKILVVLMITIMTVSMMPITVLADGGEVFNYPDLQENTIKIGNVEVTDGNKADVLGDGKVSYDSESKTLKLDNANIGEEDAPVDFGICASVENLNIVVSGDSSIYAKFGGIYNKGTLNISGSGKLRLYGGNVKESLGIFSEGVTTINDIKLYISDFFDGISCYLLDGPNLEDADQNFIMNGGLIRIKTYNYGISGASIKLNNISSINIVISGSSGSGLRTQGMKNTDDASGEDGDIRITDCDNVSLYSEGKSPLHSDADSILSDCKQISIVAGGRDQSIEANYGNVEIINCDSVDLHSDAECGIHSQRDVKIKNSKVSIKAYQHAIYCDSFVMENTNLEAFGHYNNKTVLGEDENGGDYAIEYSVSCELKSGTAKLAGYPAAIFTYTDTENAYELPVIGENHLLRGNTEYNDFTSLSEINYDVKEDTWDSPPAPVWYVHSAIGNDYAKSVCFESFDEPTLIEMLREKIAELESKIQNLETKLAAPGTPAISKLTRTKTKISVKWNATNKATSYQVYYRRKGKSSGKIVSVSGRSKTIKNLKRKKTYYIKVRALKKSGNILVYGNWSKQKSIKTQ